MNISKIKTYTLEIILIILLIVSTILKINELTLAGILLIYSILVCILIKKKNNNDINKKFATKIIIILGFLFVALIYVIGIYTGFYKSYYLLSLKNTYLYIIPICIIITTLEIIRNKFLTQTSLLSKSLTLTSLVLADYTLFASFYDLTLYSDFIDAIGLIIFTSISSNLLYNYISPKYGYKAIIIYRLTITLYKYIIPITPDIYILFDSLIRILYPILVYKIISYGYELNEEPIIKTKNEKLLTILSTIFIILYACLISGKFTYTALVIGSESMSNSINKGDVIIYKKLNQKEHLKNNDIIVFKKNEIITVHRIVSIKQVNEETRYITKGDSNQKNDEGYITEENIKGKVKTTIREIGKPTLWLRNLFKRGKI